jgi:hypothetical protein
MSTAEELATLVMYGRMDLEEVSPILMRDIFADFSEIDLNPMSALELGAFLMHLTDESQERSLPTLVALADIAATKTPSAAETFLAGAQGSKPGNDSVNKMLSGCGLAAEKSDILYLSASAMNSVGFQAFIALSTAERLGEIPDMIRQFNEAREEFRDASREYRTGYYTALGGSKEFLAQLGFPIAE